MLQGFVEEYIESVNWAQVRARAGLLGASTANDMAQVERLRAILSASLLLGDTLGVEYAEGLDRTWNASWAAVDARRGAGRPGPNAPPSPGP